MGNNYGVSTDGDSRYTDYGNVIGGFTPEDRNIISGNSVGVYSGANRVVGNYIGTDPTGMVALPNVYGVLSGLFIGGTEPGAKNLISGNSYFGVAVSAGGRVQGNWIGLNATGNGTIGNTGFGVGANDSQIGGTTPEARNIISGNNVGIYGQGTFQGNYIGTDPSGVDGFGNDVGIYLVAGSSDNLIGGRTAGAGNLISGNSSGIALERLTGSANRIEGNTIVHNRAGVDIRYGTVNQVIGGTDSGAGNTIAFNSVGVVVQGDDTPGYYYSTRNQVVGNSIFSNLGLGIDIAATAFGNGDGITRNDLLDVDAGSNESQNFPELTAAWSAATTRVQGSLHSSPNGTFRIDFYANLAVDPSGYGEGERYLGFTTVTTDASGNATFDELNLAASSVGEFISSTATDSLGNTSEFSLAVVTVPGVQPVSVDIQQESINVDSNGIITVVVFGAADFNAARIDVNTVRFAGAVAWQSTRVDANHDGQLDMQFRFRRQDTTLYQTYVGLLIADHDEDGVLDSTTQVTQVAITGQTLDGGYFAGSDSVALFLSGDKLRDLLRDLFG